MHWDNQTVLVYKQVPLEVFRRLCSAPNPAAYWEERIAVEYPNGSPKTSGAGADAVKGFEGLFGADE